MIHSVTFMLLVQKTLVQETSELSILIAVRMAMFTESCLYCCVREHYNCEDSIIGEFPDIRIFYIIRNKS